MYKQRFLNELRDRSFNTERGRMEEKLKFLTKFFRLPSIRMNFLWNLPPHTSYIFKDTPSPLLDVWENSDVGLSNSWTLSVDHESSEF